MKKWVKKGLFVFIAELVFLGAVLAIPSSTVEAATYVGSEVCMKCHQDVYDDWGASGHAHMLRTAEEARVAGIPKPDYVSWNDVLFVLGGFGWKARYIDQDGYFRSLWRVPYSRQS